MKRLLMSGVYVVGGVLLLLGCAKQEQEQKQQQQQAPPELALQSPHSMGGSSVAGVRWTVPQGWVLQGPRQMRVVTYTTTVANGDAEGGECAVFFFGAGQGGTVDQNVDRWIGQFENPSGEARSSKEVNGLNVTLVKVNGTYVGMVAPMMQQQGQQAQKKEGYTLLGAIVNAPEGPVFFKLTGPKKSIALAENDFNSLVASLQKQ